MAIIAIMAIIAAGGIPNSLYRVPFSVLHACFPSCLLSPSQGHASSVFLTHRVPCASLHPTWYLSFLAFAFLCLCFLLHCSKKNQKNQCCFFSFLFVVFALFLSCFYALVGALEMFL